MNGGSERPFKRLSPLTPLVRSFIFVVAVIGASWHNLVQGQIGPFGLSLLAVLLIGGAVGYASWLRTKYWIEDDELRVDTGLVSRQSRRIRVDRLQAVDITQPFVARMFGLAELKMDVAGGSRAEGSLAFLPLAEAHELRAQLLARRDLVRREAPNAAAPSTEASAAQAAGAAEASAAQAAGTTRTPQIVVNGPAPHPWARPVDAPPPDPTQRIPLGVAAPMPERQLARLDLRMLLVSILLSGHTVGFLISGGISMTLFVVTGQFSGAASVLPIVGGFVLAQFRKLSAFYDFTVAETPAGLQVRRGLFERNTQTVALPRVQGVLVREPLFWRRLGWARLDVSVAGVRSSDDQGSPSASTIIPVAPRSAVIAMARHVLSGTPGADSELDSVPLAAPPARARWVAPVLRKYAAAGLGPGIVVGRSGMLTRRTQVVPYARIQSLRIEQGPWQRALRLADVVVDSPPGPVSLRAEHWDETAARQLLDDTADRARSARIPVTPPMPARSSHPSR